jgi:hypothetical protein
VAAPDFKEMQRAYLEAAMPNPKAEYSGIYMGVSFTRHADGTFSWHGAEIPNNFVYEKIEPSDAPE